MNRIQHPSNNDILGAPPGVSIDDCSALAITRKVYDLPDGSQVPAVVSFWQPTPEQLSLLNAGKPVWLSVWGRTHAPVSLGVDGDGRLS